jgi:tRNA pseudouridine38-40 synthase
MSVLHDWYTARTNNDINRLTSLLVPEFFGARLHDGTICHTTDELVTAVSKTPIDSFDLTIDSHHNDTIRFHATLHTTKETIALYGKAVLKGNRIFHLFEDIDHGTRRIKVVCAYDGSAFHGYQRQLHQPTVQQTIEEAIQDAFGLDQGISIHASGRTDRGVHAAHQVFHFDIDSQVPGDKIAGLIGSRLPDSIYLLSSEDVHPTFHSRYDIVEKEYRYKINRVRYDAIQRNYEWFVPSLNPDKLQSDAAVLVGTHDFAAFTTTANENTIRTIHAIEVEELGEHILLTFRGSGFLRYMVRYLVEALVRSNRGTLDGTIEGLLESGDHSVLDKMAPAGGLYLQHVTYR